MTTITQVITALTAAPDPLLMSRTDFSAAAASFVLAQKAMTPELNAMTSQMNTVASEVNAASASAVAAAATVAATANAIMWNALTNYLQGSCAISTVDFATYRRKIAGTTATDPSADATNWGPTIAGLAPLQADRAALVVGAGMTPNANDSTQMLGAVQKLIEARVGDYSLDTGTANSYVIALNPVIAAYTGNFFFSFKALNTNTGGSTINFGVGAVALNNDIGGALVGGDITAGMIISGNFSLADNQARITSLVQSQGDSRYLDNSLFFKLDSLSPAFVKTGANTLSIKAGTSGVVAGVKNSYSALTAVTMPTLTGGTDYAVYICTDGTIRADANFTNPTGYTTANSRMIGGFHYGLTAAGTTVAVGSFATTGNGKIWVQGDVDEIAGINYYSIWDLKFRPKCDPRGMALVSNQVWVDIYLASTDVDTNGTSKAGTNIASGTVLPKIPLIFGGNGTVTYPSMNWWVANEIARSKGKRLMWGSEFFDAAWGVTENQSIDATASTYPTTQRNAGYTSNYGIEQATGHQQVWGQDSNFYTEVASPAGSWHDFNGNNGAGTGRGQDYTFGTYGIARVVLGGSRTSGVSSGSRAAGFIIPPSFSVWYGSLRAVCDHMISL